MFGDGWLGITLDVAIGVVGTILTQGVLLVWYLQRNRIIWPPKPKKKKEPGRFWIWRRSWRWRRKD